MLKCLFISLWVIVMFALLNYKNVKCLKKLALHFNASLTPYSVFIPSLDGVYECLKFYIHMTPKFMEVRGTLKVRLYARSLVRMRIFRRSLITRAAFKSGLFQSVATGDSTFDASFLIFAPQAGTAMSFLQNAKRRQAVEQLFDGGFSVLVIDERGVWTEKRDYERNSDLEVDNISAVLNNLKILSSGI